MDLTLFSEAKGPPPYSLFECPYVRDGLESSFDHRQESCPFAHHDQGSFLCIPMPKFVCTKYLFGRECNGPLKVLPLLGDSQSQVKNCPDGVHPPLDSNLKHHLEKITASMAQSYWSSLSVSGTQDQDEPPPQCRICLEDVGSSNPNRFGLLLDCPHVFCAFCLDQWTKAQPEGDARCPVCRRDYAGMVLSSRLDVSHEEMVELYREQNQEPGKRQNFYEQISPNTPESFLRTRWLEQNSESTYSLDVSSTESFVVASPENSIRSRWSTPSSVFSFFQKSQVLGKRQSIHEHITQTSSIIVNPNTSPESSITGVKSTLSSMSSSLEQTQQPGKCHYFKSPSSIKSFVVSSPESSIRSRASVMSRWSSLGRVSSPASPRTSPSG